MTKNAKRRKSTARRSFQVVPRIKKAKKLEKSKPSVDQNEQQLSDTISLIMRRIEAKKQQIRNVLNDQLAVKKCLNELAKELFESIETGLNLDLKDSLDNINRNMLLAYSYLIDNIDGLLSDLTRGDLNVTNMLVKIHETDDFSGLNETLKSLHFGLLLFSSFSSLDSFMYDFNTTSSLSSSQIEYFQKLILKLIDHVCVHKNSLFRTRILLSIREIVN